MRPPHRSTRSSLGARRSPLAQALAPLLLGAWLGGCVSLPSRDQVLDRLPGANFVEIDGISVHVESRGDNAASPVVLVHGFGASSYSWRKVIPELARDHQVVTVDLVGFGLTDRPTDRAGYSRTGQVRMLSGLVDHFGWKSAHFVGHSYGGGLVMSLAHVAPRKVRSLVLVASTAPAYSDLRRRFLGRQPFATIFARLFLRPSWVERSLERSFWNDRLVTDELVDAYLERVRIAGASQAFAGLTAPATPDPRFADLTYPSLEPPTLAVWGAADVLIPAAGARQSIATIPDSRFVEIPECGHLPMEEKPAQLLAAMLPFLDEIDARSTGAGARTGR